MHIYLTIINIVTQGSTIGICCIRMYTYFYWHKHDFGHACIDMHVHLFPVISYSFIFELIWTWTYWTYLNLLNLLNLFELDIYLNLFFCPWRRQIICCLHFFFLKKVIFKFSYKLLGSSWRSCILVILFQLCHSKARFFESNLFWVGQCNSPPTFILEEELNQY